MAWPSMAWPRLCWVDPSLVGHDMARPGLPESGCAVLYMWPAHFGFWTISRDRRLIGVPDCGAPLFSLILLRSWAFMVYMKFGIWRSILTNSGPSYTLAYYYYIMLESGSSVAAITGEIVPTPLWTHIDIIRTVRNECVPQGQPQYWNRPSPFKYIRLF